MELKNKQNLRVKYNRVSTINQSGDRYKLDEEKYDLTLFDIVSGKQPFKDRPKAKELIKLIEKGLVSEVVVEELSRLGRNTGDCYRTLEWLEEYEVNVVIRNLGIQSRPNNKKNQLFSIIGILLNSMYELELENIKERTQMGRLVYVQNGGKLGRPENSKESDKKFLDKPKTKEIIKWLNKGRTIAEICSHTNSSNKTVIKAKKVGAKYGLVHQLAENKNAH